MLPFQSTASGVLGRLQLALRLAKLTAAKPVEAKALEHLMEAESAYMGPFVATLPEAIDWENSPRKFQMLRLYYSGAFRPACALASLRIQWQEQGTKPALAEVPSQVVARENTVEAQHMAELARVVGLCFKSCNRSLFKGTERGTDPTLAADERAFAVNAGKEDYLAYLTAKFNDKRSEFRPSRLAEIFR